MTKLTAQELLELSYQDRIDFVMFCMRQMRHLYSDEELYALEELLTGKISDEDYREIYDVPHEAKGQLKILSHASHVTLSRSPEYTSMMAADLASRIFDFMKDDVILMQQREEYYRLLGEEPNELDRKPS